MSEPPPIPNGNDPRAALSSSCSCLPCARCSSLPRLYYDTFKQRTVRPMSPDMNWLEKIVLAVTFSLWIFIGIAAWLIQGQRASSVQRDRQRAGGQQRCTRQAHFRCTPRMPTRLCSHTSAFPTFASDLQAIATRWTAPARST